MLLFVEDARRFHHENLSSDNYSHYSYIAKRLPLDITYSVQMAGTGLYFNPLIPLKSFKKLDLEQDTRKIKYGVIEIGKAVSDLETWETFGLAGRLQKPVLPFI